MPKTVRYYIHKSGEEPIVRSVPVAVQQSADHQRAPRVPAGPSPAVTPRLPQATAVARLRLALKRGIR